jgi:trehalose 6-phosphate synthase/phosphatase
MGQRKIILSVDRLDYTKGIMERLIAFDLFLKRYPEYKEKVTLIMVAVPSRPEVDSYVELKSQVDELVGRVNGTHGSLGWTPVWYLYRSIPFEMLCALYRAADVALVTPLRDGMNLIAKEFIASRHNGTGVLVLSEMAGAERELGESVLVNPNDAEAVSRALKTALTMSKDEQVERNSSMQERLQRYDVVRWVNDFMERLNGTKAIQLELQSKELTSDSLTRLVEEFAKSTKALLLLDYDGTLRSFEDAPGKAVPDDELTEILCGLTAASKNHVVIVSGRDRATLDSMFGDFNIGLISDHGVWIKKYGRDWYLVEPLSDEWKSETRTIMEHYVDRTPGSFVEEKDFSLVFHYRKADPELAEIRLRELIDDLIALTATHNVGILEGNRAIELVNADVNKGRGTSFFLEEHDWDFILAVGDDRTDEDLFAVLPDSAYSFKVGLGPSSAMYCLESVSAVRQLLRHLMEAVGCHA